eukprot:Cvel_19646.t1-p1 / transcript=Cvel_19646.t1 / gene=Cvel_19646 / organism=Chromera_velia_CCMP2878 / gene_product=Hydroxymethylglutaryl-CoA lyase, mitochondrial, putative / transcript_product=Hydroxymethylglutaryl-CoA lyase, mitochondrial, putative / location=Cvel_scaffold1711:34865-39674(+) / protein_length=255 / sequence_SO=supercontig / SO=protein_coding / is_pseudo=false
MLRSLARLSRGLRSQCPPEVKIVDVGPRDGLQNEKTLVETACKVELIKRLAAAGLKCVEATAFVSPKWVPQMGDHAEVMAALKEKDGVLSGVDLPVLAPNLKGFEGAVAAGAQEVAVFAAATESFSKKNTNCSIAESFDRFLPIMEASKEKNVRVRGYVSVALGCPYEGAVAPQAVTGVIKKLLDMGCYEVSIGDTIGCGTAGGVSDLLDCVEAEGIALDHCAIHFHDTYGQALANILVGLQRGVKVVDSSVAGL